MYNSYVWLILAYLVIWAGLSYANPSLHVITNYSQRILLSEVSTRERKIIIII